MTFLAWLAGFALLAAPAPAFDFTPFWKHWGDGQAEISTYKLVTPRYGEKREGQAVLIYVTEDMSDTLRVKADPGKHPAERRLPGAQAQPRALVPGGHLRLPGHDVDLRARGARLPGRQGQLHLSGMVRAAVSPASAARRVDRECFSQLLRRRGRCRDEDFR